MMQIPEASHPMWAIAKLIVVGVIFVTASHFLYNNGWDSKDWYTLLALLLGSSGVSLTQMLGSR